MRLNKRGQVFLMAAVIIAGVVLGAAKIVNSAKSGNDQEAFYDLTEEIDFETKRVLDYGVINSVFLQDSDIENFLSRYNEYIGSEEVVFIFGDSSGDFKAIHYGTINPFNAVSLNTGSAIPVSQPLTLTTTTIVDVISNNNAITVRIRGIDYTFNLQPGQNFYFVLIEDRNGEKFVAAR